MNSEFSFIIAFRNRPYQSVRNLLVSLSAQRFKDFEAIFVDYGSDNAIAGEVEQLVKSHSFCRYFYTDTRGRLWNKAEALNIGIKHAAGEYIVILDADLVLSGSYLDFVSKRINHEIFLTHRAYYLPKDYPIDSIVKSELPFDSKNIPVNFIGLLVVRRESALKVNGFDEFYQVWGAEDEDFNLKLESIGLKRVHIDVSEIPVWHQWHEVVAPAKPTLWYLSELNYLYAGKRATKESSPLSGRRLAFEDRPMLKAYLDGSYRNSVELKILRSDHLAFLEFYQTFASLESSAVCRFELSNAELVYDTGKMQKIVDFINRLLDGIKIFHYRLFREEKIRAINKVTFQDLKEFIEYFLGVNRNLIEDYYFRADENKITLVVKKSMRL